MSSEYPVYGRFIEGGETDKSYGVPTPSAPLLPDAERVKLEQIDPSFKGWISAMGDSVALQPLWQYLGESLETIEGFDPNYDPFSPENIEGYEAYANEFIGVRSKARQDFLKQRIDKNQERRTNVARELGLGGILLSEALNPINYVPLPGMIGKTALTVKSTLKAGASFGAAITAEEALRQSTDPTATTEESRMNIVYGTLFGAALGAGVGAFSKLGTKDIERFSNEFSEWTVAKRKQTGQLDVDPAEYITSTTGFTARPTAGVDTGYAKAYGLEKLSTMPFVGKMLNSGIRAVEDFTQGMVGDYGVMLERNKRNIPTEDSAFLAADMWRGLATEGASNLRSLYARYRTGSEGTTIGGVNLTTDVQRAAEFFGSRGRAGEKMTYEEFLDEIFRAHKRDEIKAEDPFVKEGVDIVRNFFDHAEKSGSETGSIRGVKARRNFIQRKTNRARQIIQRMNELEAKESLSVNEIIKLQELSFQYDDLLSDLGSATKIDLADDDGLAELIAAIDAEDLARQEKLKETRKSIIEGTIDKQMALERMAADIEQTLANNIERYTKLRDALQNTYETKGLTKSQETYLAILNEIVDGKWAVKLEPTAKQKAVLEKAEASRTVGILESLSEKQRAYLNIIEDRLAGIYDDLPVSPKNEKFYLPRYWLIDEIIADEAGPQHLRKILFDWFKENPLPGARYTPESIAARVENTINKIISTAELGELQIMAPTNKKGSASASFLKSRDIDIPNELVADFIETDVEKLMRTYGHRFGTVNEITAKFGDSSAKDAIDDVLLTAIDELDIADFADGSKQVAALRADLERVRDTATGAIYSNDPAMLNKRRLASNAKAYGTITSLGGAGISSLTEIMRPMMVFGFRRTFGATLDKVFGNPELYKGVSKQILSVTNQAGEVFNSSSLSRFVQEGGPTGASSSRIGRAAQKMTDIAHGPFHIATLLGPITDMNKNWSSFLTHQFFIEDIYAIADGSASAKQIANMASYGISKEDAIAITKMPIEKENDIFLANIREWPDEALAKRYSSAVNGMVRRIIPTASGADLPEIAKGFVKGREFPLLTLPFQFMAYGFAAANKVLLSALQGRDESAYMGIAAMIGMGYAVSSIKAELSGSSWYWDNANATERMVRAVDQSGVFGIYSEIPTMVETATLGEVGIRPLLGLDPYSRSEDYVQAMTDVSGPAVGKISDLMRVMFDDDASSSEIGGAIRRSIPFNNLFYVQSLMKDAQKGITNFFEDDYEDDPAQVGNYYTGPMEVTGQD